MPNSRHAPVTVLGLGSMGQALARALAAAGHPVTVWNRTPGKAEPLMAEGATFAPDAAGAVAASPLTIVCLLDASTVLKVLGEAGSALDGQTVVNLTSGTPDDARLLEERITAQGAGYVDGAIMAVPEMIGQPEAQILYSGSRPAFDTHRTTLQVLSPTSPFLGEDAGAAALYDTALLALLYATMSGWLHAYALAAAGGVDATALQPYAQAWFTHVVAADDSRVVAEQVDRGQYPDTVGSNLSLNAFGLGLVARAFREAGVSADLFAGLTRLAEQRVAEGHGDDGFTSLVEAIKRPAADRATGA